MHVEEIKRLWPNPIAVPNEATPTGYCVGGACLMHADLTQAIHAGQTVTWFDGEGGVVQFPLTISAFPDEEELAAALVAMNPMLSQTQAYDFACRTIVSNDEARFDDAWAAMDAALGYGADFEDEPCVA